MKNMMKEVMFADDDHVWIDNRQFISLERFLEEKNSIIKETQLINEKLAEIAAEN